MQEKDTLHTFVMQANANLRTLVTDFSERVLCKVPAACAATVYMPQFLLVLYKNMSGNIERGAAREPVGANYASTTERQHKRVAPVLEGKVEAASLNAQGMVLLARLPDGWRVDKRQDLLRVFDHELVVLGRVIHTQVPQIHVFVNWAGSGLRQENRLGGLTLCKCPMHGVPEG